MNASKENAEKAANELEKLIGEDYDHYGDEELDRAREFVQEFLEVARRKLPYEKSFQKEKVKA